MGDLARQPDLLLEALQGDPVAREGFGTERLDGHRLLQLPVERAIDHAHPARPQDLLHFVPIGEQGPGPEQRARRSERRARALQLLGGRRPGGGHHVLHQVRLFLQVGDEALERLGQHADLVGARYLDVHGVVAVLHATGGERQPANWAGDLSGQHICRAEGQEQAQEHSEADGALQRTERAELSVVRAERHEAAERVAARRADRAGEADQVLAGHAGRELRAGRVVRQRSHRTGVRYERRLDGVARQCGADDVRPVERVEGEEHHVGGGCLLDFLRQAVVDGVRRHERALRRGRK